MNIKKDSVKTITFNSRGGKKKITFKAVFLHGGRHDSSYLPFKYALPTSGVSVGHILYYHLKANNKSCL